MEKPLVSIIIVNWNGLEHLKICFSSLTKLKYSNFETILVDNGSTDGSVEYVKKNYPKVILVQNKKNLGFAEANNVGFKKAGGEYILLLNNDVKVTSDFLTKLVQVLEAGAKIGVGQPKIILLGSKRLQSGGAFLTSTGFLYHFGREKNPSDKKYNQQMPIFSANGSCMLIRREVIEKVGLFDPDLFCYFEESDFCWRAWLAGYKTLYIPSAVIWHKGGRTSRRFKSSFIQYHSFKNRICSLIKNLGRFELLKILPVHLMFCQLAAIGLFFKGGLSTGWAVQRAIAWNIVHLKKTLKKRKKIQGKIRKISDKELMPKVKKFVRPLYFYYLLIGLGSYKD